MSVKDFFKGKAFKCIAVLLCVLLVSGVLLSIFWGFLEVTEEERFNRRIGEVYGGDTVTAIEQDLSGKTTKVGNATIQKMWYVQEKNDYLVQVAARGNGGDVICWVAVSLNDEKTEVDGISKVLLYRVDDPAEYKDYIPDSVYEKFAKEYTDGKKFEYGFLDDGTKGDEYIATGATNTMTAICNDVNSAVTFVKAYVSGEEIIDPTAGFEYVDFINFDLTSWVNDNGEITYSIVTKSNGMAQSFTIDIKVSKVNGTAQITAFEIITNGSTSGFEADMSSVALQNMVGKTLADIEQIFEDEANLGEGAGEKLHTGATRSNELCYNAAAFALANYDKCLEADKLPESGGPSEDGGPSSDYEYADLIDLDATTWSDDNGEVSYNIVTKSNGMAESFTISIKVSKVNGTAQITAFEIITNGSTYGFEEDMSVVVLQNMVGMSLADIEQIFEDEEGLDEGEGESLHTGATRSNELCFNAAAFALANYEEVTANE